MSHSGSPAEALHAHLIDVAERLLGRRLLSSITTREVAREAGVSDGVLYNYFSDKHGLLLAASLRRFERLVQTFAGDVPKAGSGTLEANLVAICSAQIAFQSKMLPLVVGMLSEPALLRRFVDEIHGHSHGPPYAREQVRDYLVGEQQRGRISPDVEPDAVATLIMGAGQLMAFADHFGPVLASREPRRPLQEQVGALVDVLVRGLRPSRPRR